MRCPRCERESPRPTPFCTGCGAPLLLRDEGAPPPLDAPLELERRGRGGADPDPGATFHGVLPPPLPGPPPAEGEAQHADELAALERSHWDLGRAAAARETARDTARDALPDPEVDMREVHVVRAEDWRRVVAWLVDAVPFAAAGIALARRFVREAGAALSVPPEGLDGLLDLLARERVIAVSVACAVALALAVYATLAHALGGATLGKRLVGIRVVGPDGAPPSPARSAIRSGLALVSAALLGLGFLLAFFTRTGRALHDLVARTWVVKAP